MTNQPDLLSAVLAAVVAFGGLWAILKFVHYRHLQSEKRRSKEDRQFANESDYIVEAFQVCKTRRELFAEELSIDRFKWYWIERRPSEEVEKVCREKLYEAFYKRVAQFSNSVNHLSQ